MFFPFFFLLFIVWHFFLHDMSEFSEPFQWFLFQPPPLDSVALLLFCFSLFPRWISLLCCLLCFLVIFCSSFCCFFLRVFLTSRFYPWFPSLPSLFRLLCYSLDVQRKWGYLVSFCSLTPFYFFFLLSLLRRRNLFLFSQCKIHLVCSNFMALPVRLAGNSQRWGKEDRQGVEVCPPPFQSQLSHPECCVWHQTKLLVVRGEGVGVPAVSPGECPAGAVLPGLDFLLVLAFPVCFPSNNSNNRAHGTAQSSHQVLGLVPRLDSLSHWWVPTAVTNSDLKGRCFRGHWKGSCHSFKKQ